MTTTATQIIEEIGASIIADRLGVGKSSIRQVRIAGTFPASWFGVIRDLCRDRGIDCPMELFRFKGEFCTARIKAS